MGIVADLDSISVIFTDPKKNVPMGAITNAFLCVQHAFEISFGIHFDPNPRKGVGGSPATKEAWQVGIVQNVLFEMYNFTYDDGSTFRTEFKHPVVDAGNKFYAPFYNEPVIVQACKLDPMLKCSKYIPIMIPVADIWYTSQGFGELLDPYNAIGVATSNKPDSFNLIDEPFFGARLRLPNGALIKRAESISAFQTWLVAQHGSTTDVLATVPPFSLAFWMETHASPGLLTIDTPPYDFAFYGEAGISTKVKADGEIAHLTPRLGDGGRRPVLSGELANDRANNWAKGQGLTP